MTNRPDLSDIEILELQGNLQEDWDAFLDIHGNGNLLQSWSWGDFKQLSGEGVWRFGLFRSGELIGIAQTIQHKHLLGNTTSYLFRGPVIDPQYADLLGSFISHLAGLIRIQRVDRFVIEPNADDLVAKINFQSLRFRPTANLQPIRTLILDLTQGEEALLESFKPKTRYNIRLAEKNGVSVQISTDRQDLLTAIDMIQQSARRQQIKQYSTNYFETLFDTFIHHDQTAILTAYYQQKPLASLLLVFVGETAYYLYGGMVDENRELMSNHLLHFEAIKYSIKKGMSFYDFWGIAQPGDANYDKWQGISRFKLGFGGQEILYPQAQHLLFRKTRYRLTQLATMLFNLPTILRSYFKSNRSA